MRKKMPHRYKMKCHKPGINRVFPIGNGKIMYAGSQFDGTEPLPGMLFIDLLAGRQALLSANYQTNYLDSFLVKTISIPWEDMSIPNLPNEFWDSLAQEIISQNQNTLVACAGGHGRTGTALAILAWELIQCPNPIEFVRWAYCKNAVETREQKEYVEEITGIYEDIEITGDGWLPWIK